MRKRKQTNDTSPGILLRVKGVSKRESLALCYFFLVKRKWSRIIIEEPKITSNVLRCWWEKAPPPPLLPENAVYIPGLLSGLSWAKVFTVMYSTGRVDKENLERIVYRPMTSIAVWSVVKFWTTTVIRFIRTQSEQSLSICMRNSWRGFLPRQTKPYRNHAVLI